MLGRGCCRAREAGTAGAGGNSNFSGTPFVHRGKRGCLLAEIATFTKAAAVIDPSSSSLRSVSYTLPARTYVLVIALFNQTTLYLDKRRIKGTERERERKRETNPVSRRYERRPLLRRDQFTLITLSANGYESLWLDPLYI